MDLTQPNSRDYIGSARVPLRECFVKGEIKTVFAVIDDKRKTNGELEVHIQCLKQINSNYNDDKNITQVSSI